MRTEPVFEIVEHIGVIAEYPIGWKKELNRVSWNGGPAKYDIRDWDKTHEFASRGVSLTDEEAQALVALMNDRLKEVK